MRNTENRLIKFMHRAGELIFCLTMVIQYLFKIFMEGRPMRKFFTEIQKKYAENWQNLLGEFSRKTIKLHSIAYVFGSIFMFMMTFESNAGFSIEAESSSLNKDGISSELQVTDDETDPIGTPIDAEWTVIEEPVGGGLILNATMGASITISADINTVAGEYRIQANDPGEIGEEATIVITVNPITLTTVIQDFTIEHQDVRYASNLSGGQGILRNSQDTEIFHIELSSAGGDTTINAFTINVSGPDAFAVQNVLIASDGGVIDSFGLDGGGRTSELQLNPSDENWLNTGSQSFALDSVLTIPEGATDPVRLWIAINTNDRLRRYNGGSQGQFTVSFHDMDSLADIVNVTLTESDGDADNGDSVFREPEGIDDFTATSTNLRHFLEIYDMQQSYIPAEPPLVQNDDNVNGSLLTAGNNGIFHAPDVYWPSYVRKRWDFPNINQDDADNFNFFEEGFPTFGEPLLSTVINYDTSTAVIRIDLAAGTDSNPTILTDLAILFDSLLGADTGNDINFATGLDTHVASEQFLVAPGELPIDERFTGVTVYVDNGNIPFQFDSSDSVIVEAGTVDFWIRGNNPGDNLVQRTLINDLIVDGTPFAALIDGNVTTFFIVLRVDAGVTDSAPGADSPGGTSMSFGSPFRISIANFNFLRGGNADESNFAPNFSSFVNPGSGLADSFADLGGDLGGSVLDGQIFTEPIYPGLWLNTHTPTDSELVIPNLTVESNGFPSAMIGIDLAYSQDPVTQQSNELTLAQIKVDLTEGRIEDLASLTNDMLSGVSIWKEVGGGSRYIPDSGDQAAVEYFNTLTDLVLDADGTSSVGANIIVENETWPAGNLVRFQDLDNVIFEDDDEDRQYTLGESLFIDQNDDNDFSVGEDSFIIYNSQKSSSVNSPLGLDLGDNDGINAALSNRLYYLDRIDIGGIENQYDDGIDWIIFDGDIDGLWDPPAEILVNLNPQSWQIDENGVVFTVLDTLEGQAIPPDDSVSGDNPATAEVEDGSNAASDYYITMRASSGIILGTSIELTIPGGGVILDPQGPSAPNAVLKSNLITANVPVTLSDRTESLPEDDNFNRVVGRHTDVSDPIAILGINVSTNDPDVNAQDFNLQNLVVEFYNHDGDFDFDVRRDLFELDSRDQEEQDPPSDVLSGDLEVNTLVIELNDASAFENPPRDDVRAFVQIDDEVISYTNKNGNFLENIRRGERDTAPAFHSINSVATQLSEFSGISLWTDNNSIAAILENDISDSVTEIEVDGGQIADFPDPDGRRTEFVTIGDEIISYTDIAQTSPPRLLNCRRGVGSPASSHASLTGVLAGRNGLFDPNIDTNVVLDRPPYPVGVPGSPTQIQIDFVSERILIPINDKGNNRGDEVFVVIRSTNAITDGDNFSVGIASWVKDGVAGPDPDKQIVEIDPDNAALTTLVLPTTTLGGTDNAGVNDRTAVDITTNFFNLGVQRGDTIENAEGDSGTITDITTTVNLFDTLVFSGGLIFDSGDQNITHGDSFILPELGVNIIDNSGFVSTTDTITDLSSVQVGDQITNSDGAEGIITEIQGDTLIFANGLAGGFGDTTIMPGESFTVSAATDFPGGSITLADSTGFIDPDPDDDNIDTFHAFVQINNEIISYTNLDPATDTLFNIRRAQKGTFEQSHFQGAQVTQVAFPTGAGSINFDNGEAFQQLRTNILLVDSVAPSDISSVVTLVQDELINITWTQPVDSDLQGILVLKSRDENFETPQDNFPVLENTLLDVVLIGDDLSTTAGSAVISSNINLEAAGILGRDLVNGLPGHFVVIRNGDDAGRYEVESVSGTTLTLTTALTSASTRPLSFEVGDDLVVSTRNSTSVTETEENGGIVNNQTYQYKLFAFDRVPNFSPGVEAAVFPSADSNAPDPVTGLQGAVGDERIDLTWSNPDSGDFVEVLVVRSFAGITVEQPQKGVQHDVGETLGLGNIILFIGNAEAFTDFAVTNGQAYTYRVYARDNSFNYSPESSVTAIPSADDVPPVIITNFVANRGNARVSLNWTNPVDSDFAGTLILRTEEVDGPPTANEIPTEGASFNVGDIIGNATVIFRGNASSFNDEDVINGTGYFYQAFAFDEVPNYADAVSVTPFPVTPTDDVIPPGPVIDLNAIRGDEEISLTWQNPSDADFEGVIVLRREGGVPSTAPADETEFTGGEIVGDAEVIRVFRGGEIAFTDSGLTNGIIYFYAFYTFDSPSFNYSTAATINRVPGPPASPSPVSGLGSSVEIDANNNRDIVLSWANPAGIAGQLIVRRIGTPVIGDPVDGRVYQASEDFDGGGIVVGVINDGTATTFTDQDLEGGFTYHYRLFTFDTFRNYSTGTSVSQVVNTVITNYIDLTTPGQSIDSLSDPTPIFGINILDSGVDAVLATINIQLNNNTGTEITDIAAILPANSASGVAVYGDTDGNGIFDSTLDTILNLTAPTDWDADNNLAINLASGFDVPDDDTNNGPDLFVVIRTSNTIQFQNELEFTVSDDNGVVYFGGPAGVGGIITNVITANIPVTLSNLVEADQEIEVNSLPTGVIAIDSGDPNEDLSSLTVSLLNVGGDVDVTPADLSSYSDFTRAGGFALFRDGRSPAPSILAVNVDSTVTTITLADATNYPPTGAVQIGNELMSYSSIVGNDLNVTRGLEGTTATSHPAGAPVHFSIPQGIADLAGDIDDAVITIALEPGGTIRLVDPNEGFTAYIRIDNEIIGYTGISGDNLLNCTRGAKGSTPAAHTDADNDPSDIHDAYIFALSMASGLSATATILRVDGRPFSPLSDTEPAFLTIGREFISYTGILDNLDGTWNITGVTRGIAGSAATAHANTNIVRQGRFGFFDGESDSLVFLESEPDVGVTINLNFQDQVLDPIVDGINDFFLTVSTSAGISAGDDFQIQLSTGSLDFSNGDPQKSITSGVLTAIDIALETSVILGKANLNTTQASVGDTMTIVFDRSVDPASITAELVGSNVNNAFAAGGGFLSGTLTDLFAEVGTFEVLGTVLATESRLELSADGITATITLGGEITFDGESVEPSGMFTPDPSLQDAQGNSVAGEYIVAGTWDSPDTDNDGLPDAFEIMFGLDPGDPDSDSNNIIDGNDDFDNDGLTNLQEFENFETFGDFTNPNNPDSDGDQLSDGDEANTFNTNPTVADSDDDGALDGVEIGGGYDPLNSLSKPNRAKNLILTSPGNSTDDFGEIEFTDKHALTDFTAAAWVKLPTASTVGITNLTGTAGIVTTPVFVDASLIEVENFVGTDSSTIVLKSVPADGDILSLDDDGAGANAAINLEFDNGDGVAVGNVAVLIAGSNIKETVSNLIAAIDSTGFFDAEPAGRIVMRQNAIGVQGNIAITAAPGTNIEVDGFSGGDATTAATGSITLRSLVIDGETVTLNDGIHSVTFEFDDNLAFTIGNYRVAIQTTLDETVASFIRAINETFFVGDGAKIVLTQDNFGVLRNTSIAAVSPAISATGFFDGDADTLPSGNITFSDLPSDGAFVIISDNLIVDNGKVVPENTFTFEFDSDTIIETGNIAVDVGATVRETAENLVNAINASSITLESTAFFALETTASRVQSLSSGIIFKRGIEDSQAAGTFLSNYEISIVKGAVSARFHTSARSLHELPADDPNSEPIAVGDGEWHHIATLLDSVADRFQLFVDGKLVASTVTGDLPIRSAGSIRILGGWNAGDELTASVDEIRLYNDALTAGSIQSLGEKVSDIDRDGIADLAAAGPIQGTEGNLIVGIRFDDDQAGEDADENGLVENPSSEAQGAEDFTDRLNFSVAAQLTGDVVFAKEDPISIVPIGRDNSEDIDNDELPDWFELEFAHLDPSLVDTDGDNTRDDEEDFDGDNCSARAELEFGTSPIRFDNDGDGMDDSFEKQFVSRLNHFVNDAHEDFDFDGLTNLEEYLGADGEPPRIPVDPINDPFGISMTNPNDTRDLTNPLQVDPDSNADADGDGLPDQWEIDNGLNPDNPFDANEDFDNDGLTNLFEFLTNNDPNSSDSDGDGLSDGSEDLDGDGLANIDEQLLGTDPQMVDTDDDGFNDRLEVNAITSPLHPMSVPNSENLNIASPQSLSLATGDAVGDIQLPASDRFKFGENAWTIEVWINPESELNLTGDIIVFQATTGSGYRLSLDNGVPHGVIFQAGTNNIIVEVGGTDATAALAPDRWTHLALSWSPSENTFRLYRDGILLIAQQSLANPNFSGNGAVNIVRGFGASALGYVDEIRVWQLLRTGAEIEFWHNRLFPTQEAIDLEDYEFGEPLHAYYRFDDGGQFVEDFAHLNEGDFSFNIANLDNHLRPGVNVLGHDDADGDGVPEWWIELHELNEYAQFGISPFPVFDAEEDCAFEGINFGRSFTNYMSIGAFTSWLEDLAFITTKSNSLGIDGTFSSLVKYLNLIRVPAEASIEITAFDITLDSLFVNGVQFQAADATGGNLAEGLTFDITSALQSGRNQIALEITRGVSSVLENVIGFCNEEEQQYNRNLYQGKLDVSMIADGVELIVRGDDSRFDPRAVWHGTTWSQYIEDLPGEPPRQDDRARELPNLDYGIPRDPDGDGLENAVEFLLGTNPRDRDSDNNGIADGDEDFDIDGVNNTVEVVNLIDPTRVDTDDDGINDGEEIAENSQPNDGNSPELKRSISFNGSDTQFIELPLQSRFALKTFTIEAWIRPGSDNDGGTVVRRVVGTVNGDTLVNYGIQLNNTGNPVAFFTDASGLANVAQAVGINPIPRTGEIWTHLAATYDSSTQLLSLYVNGEVAQTAFTVRTPISLGPGQVFTRGGENFEGFIDEVRIWDISRPAQDIQNTLASVLTGEEANLVAYYRFDDGQSNATPNGAQDNLVMLSRDWETNWQNAAILFGGAEFVEFDFVPFQNRDSDGDGLPDQWEMDNGFDIDNPADASEDPDSDGLTNLFEFLTNNDPNESDTDSNGVEDGFEDFDDDGLVNLDEQLSGTDPQKKDTDDDGVNDNVELAVNPIIPGVVKTNPRFSMSHNRGMPPTAKSLDLELLATPASGVVLPFSNRFNRDGDDWTIEAYIKIDTDTTGEVISYDIGDAKQFRLSLDNANPKIQFTDRTGNIQELATNVSLADGEWHYLGAIWNSVDQILTLYVDALIFSRDDFNETSGRPAGGAGPLNIGRDLIDGLVDEIRIWNTARSKEEIASSMKILVQSRYRRTAGELPF